MAATTTRAACRALFMLLVVLGVSASDDFGPSPDVDTLDIINHRSYRVSPVIAPRQGSPALSFTAVELKGYEYVLGIPMPHGWSGRIWGRTDCSTDGNGKFACATGDCGSGRLECDGGIGPAPAAATVAEFALGGRNGTDTYDISLADGYNLPMLVAPYDTSHGGGSGQCAPTQCVVDLNGACPADQQVNASGRVVACRPSGNSGAFENACPTARSYAVVDAAAVNNTYTVTFCPDNNDFTPSLDEQRHDILNIKNNCSFSVAPVIVAKPGSPPLDFTPYQFMGYEYLVNIALPHGWSGLIWARTGCSTDDGGRFTCATGDCGSGRLECASGARPVPSPATIAVLTLGGRGGTDNYHISVADGYNVPVLVTPYDASRGGPCAPAQCVVDLNGACPADQQVKASDGRVVACKPSGNPVSSNIACTPSSSSSSCAVVDNSYTVTFCPDNSEFDPNSPISTSN